uniref:S-adenosyl-L-methionine:benzoic acid/salicylic acid carboxyl methyltransferase 3-like n=1 Tax=Erigeron canadensis TaxID=72917 RepID=UPI001CB9694E|nr:S-adenosyl-L-methionine:benzoic acid/salicylic acid carboxyl methyltransferase 3-like [Erigeron canadensis]
MGMDAVNVLHMNSGDGESSYANNSLVQETVLREAQPVLRQTIKDIAKSDDMFGQCFKIADLGCSSGPNTLLTASNIIDMVHEASKENNRKTPQFQVCLNDLYGNDFNSVFESLPTFLAKLKEEKGESFGPCFVSAVPGSFYDRLFPDDSLHLVHSSYSLHWLSQVPKGLEKNTSHIYVARTSPTEVFEAYQKQYATDFTMFLQARAKELVPGGRMVLTLMGRKLSDLAIDDCGVGWEVLAQTLLDMAKQGLVKESDVDSFNMPYYNPCEDEIRDVIEKEGSFSLDVVSTFRGNWDALDKDYTSTKASSELSIRHGKNTAKMVRACLEPLLAIHFGSSVIDKLFENYGKRVAEHLAVEKTRHYNIAISLTKK